MPAPFPQNPARPARADQGRKSYLSVRGKWGEGHYNGNSSSCTTTAVSSPITQRNVNDQYGSSGLQCQHNYFYSSVGGLREQDDFDYGSGGPGPLLRKSLVTYASLGNITAFRQTLTICNGTGSSSSCAGPSGGSTGTVVSQTSYNYDGTSPAATSGIAQHTSVSGSRGNLTSINYPTGGLAAHFTYYDTGSPYTSQDVNGSTTTYNYSNNTADCQMAFPTSISEPLSLSRSMTWNCTGGVQLTSTDESNQTTTTTWSDADFWRPASVTDPLGNALNYYYQPNPTYGSPFEIFRYMTFNNGNSEVGDAQYMDGLGRTYTDQHPQAPNSSTLDSVSYTFDSNGRPYSVSTPCSIGYAGTCSTPKTTQTYDALNRPLQSTDAGSGTLTYSYSNNDVLVTVGPAPSGENTKQRQLEYDALGRLTSVCEITAGTTAWPGASCGQNTSATGYLTKYTYNALGNLLTVTQNAQSSSNQQTRSYSFDAMGRLTSETNAESGTRTYTYDTDSTCGTSTGDVVKRVDNAGNVTCFSYDALHRLAAMKFPSGPNSGSTPSKYFAYDSSSYWPQLTNTKGRLLGGHTCWEPCSSLITDMTVSYSARGEMTDIYESTPNSGGYYHVTQSYWASGAPYQLSGLPGLPTISYGGTIGSTVGLDGEGRITQVTAGSGQNPVTVVSYSTGSLPTQVNFGSGDSDIFAYDSNTLRMTQFKFNVGTQSQSLNGALTWNANGTLGQLAITDQFNSGNTQTCNYSHDDLVRVASANCGSAAAQTFSFDPFGNINKSGSPNQFQPTYSASTNRFSSVPGCSTLSYDNNGNVTNDCNHSYSWDANGNSVSIDSVGLIFDAFDRMVEQNRSGSYTQIVYGPGGGKLALMSGQSLVRAFVPLPGQATAVYTSNGLDHYRHSDHLGSARLTSSPSQSYISSMAYAPFGETYASNGTTDPSFTGQNPDTTGSSTSSDYDFLFREYSNEGRWASPDPAGLAAVDPSNPQSWNRYAYVLNSPLSHIDPTGMCGQVFDNSSRGCDGGAYYGGGMGMSCIVDGIDAGCGDALRLIDLGQAAVCPDNNCTGWTLGADGNFAKQIAIVVSFWGPGLQCEPSDEVEGTASTCTSDVQSTGFHTWENVTVAAPISENMLWWANFTTSFTDGLNSGSGVQWASSKGYYTCVGKDLAGVPTATKVTEEAVTKTLENPAAGKTLAGVSYGLTDGRFTAWGKYSEVLVPARAAKIANFAEKASPYGWLLFEAEAGKALVSCTDVLQ